MSDLISVIIPIYNRRTAFASALVSVYKQAYRPIEVIIIDDGSTEDVFSIVEKFKNRAPDINTIYHRQENKGAPAARNKGLELSRGNYVIFWDADVLGDDQMLEKMHQALQDNKGASFAYSSYHFGKKMILTKDFNVEELKKNNYIHSTSLIRREDVVKWDENLKRFQDWDLWLTMVEQGKIGVRINSFLFMMIPGGTMSSWLPKCAYKKPWKYLPGIKSRVYKYEKAKEVVERKHELT